MDALLEGINFKKFGESQVEKILVKGLNSLGKIPSWAVKETAQFQTLLNAHSKGHATISAASGTPIFYTTKAPVVDVDKATIFMDFAFSSAEPELLPELLAGLESIGLSSELVAKISNGVDLLSGGSNTIANLLIKAGIPATAANISHVQTAIQTVGQINAYNTKQKEQQKAEITQLAQLAQDDVAQFVALAKQSTSAQDTPSASSVATPAGVMPSPVVTRNDNQTYLSIDGSQQVAYTGGGIHNVPVTSIPKD